MRNSKIEHYLSFWSKATYSDTPDCADSEYHLFIRIRSSFWGEILKILRAPRKQKLCITLRKLEILLPSVHCNFSDLIYSHSPSKTESNREPLSHKKTKYPCCPILTRVSTRQNELPLSQTYLLPGFETFLRSSYAIRIAIWRRTKVRIGLSRILSTYWSYPFCSNQGGNSTRISQFSSPKISYYVI